MAHELGMLEAAAAGLLEGVGAVIPISGLGHAVLIGSLGNGAGADLAPSASGYLYSYLRLAVGAALVVHFWRDWVWFGRGLVGQLVDRAARETERRWAWLVLLGVVPPVVLVAALSGRAAALTTHPVLAGICLIGNGLLLLAVWWWFRRSPRSGGLSGSHRAKLTRREDAEAFVAESAAMRGYRVAAVGVLCAAVLVPGVSGVGLAISAGLLWGLTQEQAARLALLLLGPVLLGWGLVDLPDLGAARFDAVRSAVLVGTGTALVAAYLAVSLALRYFRSASLRPFGVYCVLAGAAALVWLG
jgi:undecaprenyl-diphosphatase